MDKRLFSGEEDFGNTNLLRRNSSEYSALHYCHCCCSLVESRHWNYPNHLCQWCVILGYATLSDSVMLATMCVRTFSEDEYTYLMGLFGERLKKLGADGAYTPKGYVIVDAGGILQP